MLAFGTDALIDRLTDGLVENQQKAALLLGSALSLPSTPNGRGVGGANDILQMIEDKYFSQDPNNLREYITSRSNKYQAAFEFLISRRGQGAANAIIFEAVMNSSVDPSRYKLPQYSAGHLPSDEIMKSIESDTSGWSLSAGTEAVGDIISSYPSFYGGPILTTNFDPLIGISIRKAGGTSYRTVLHRDGDINQTVGDGAHIVHLHGYWWGADTLHTSQHLQQARPRLKSSLMSLLRSQLLVVCGYGGWDDIVNDALVDLVQEDQSSPEIIWAINSDVPSKQLERFEPLASRGRFTIYTGVDCNLLFPEVRKRLGTILAPSVSMRRPEPGTGPLSVAKRFKIPPVVTPPHEAPNPRTLLSRDVVDHPPNIDIYVGRAGEFATLTADGYRVAIVTGIGGQGKSALAARYYAHELASKTFEYCIWRDCKEESERIESQVARIVSALSRGELPYSDLVLLEPEQLVQLLVHHLSTSPSLLVFDNIDYYIDLEKLAFVGLPKLLIKRALSEGFMSKIIFTCRSNIVVDHPRATSVRLSGLDLNEAIALFSKRHATADHTDIAIAHSQTVGHAFWLDLLASQVAERSGVRLQDLLQPHSSGQAEIPTETLQSIWKSLREREQLVLRALAETVRPATVAELATFLSGRLNYNKLQKAISYLRSLSLLVFKQTDSDNEGMELHPLVREFVRRNFSKEDRRSYIGLIISYYEKFFLVKVGNSAPAHTLRDLQTWTESVELNIEAGNIATAIDLLREIDASNLIYKNPREYLRVARLLVREIDWASHERYPRLDGVVSDITKCMIEMGYSVEARQTAARYRETIEAKSARYINYCDLMCYLEWYSGSFDEAMRWGNDGKTLKERAGVDSYFDTRHNLALAQRDRGFFEQALTYFLQGNSVESVLDPDDLDDEREGGYYGNIGRCLHLMGQVDTALVCYQKSAILLESNKVLSPLNNKAYARQWIGEVLHLKGDGEGAGHFFSAALRIWAQLSPVRAQRLEEFLAGQEFDAMKIQDADAAVAERFVMNWIFGPREQN